MKQKLRLGDCYALTKQKLRHHKTRYISLLAVLTSMCLYAQAQRPEPSGPVLSGIDTVSAARDTIVIEEVEINTGYQRIPRERATGSFVFVDSALLNRVVSADIISRLKAVVPSLSFDERDGITKLNIRGISTIYANEQPLIILDNFPYDGDITNINPNDVASISILKDAAAASIWGVRAGNGVIVITTKNGGKRSQFEGAFNSFVSIANKPDVYYVPQMATSDFIDVEMFLYENRFYDADLRNTTSRPPVSPVVELLASMQDEDHHPAIDALRSFDVRRDIEKYMYRQRVDQQYAANISGSGKKYAYYTSVGYDSNLLSEVGNRNSRFSISSRNTFKPVEKLEVTADLNYVRRNDNRNNTLQELVTGGPNGKVMYPYSRFVSDTGIPLSIVKDYRQSYKDEIYKSGLQDWNYVPLDELALANNRRMMDDMRIQIGGKYELTEGLNVYAWYQFKEQKANAVNMRDERSYYARNLINRYTTVFPSSIKNNLPVGGIRSEDSDLMKSNSMRIQGVYDKSFGDHFVTAILGTEIKDVTTTGNGNVIYGYKPHLGTGVAVNADTLYRRLPNGSGRIAQETTVGRTTDKFRSFYFNGSYGYAGRYTISASGRIDQSNYFGIAANQRSVPLWSLGAKWAIHKESFFADDWFDKLAVRTTFGYNGNIDKSVTAYTTARFSTQRLTGQTAAFIVNPANRDLHWEKTGILNIGIDFSILGRIGGTFEVYRRWSDGLIGTAPLDYTSGVLEYRGNLAQMESGGVDFSLNADIIRKGLRWNLALFGSYVHEKVTRYNADHSISTYLIDASYDRDAFLYVPTVGKPLFGIYSHRWGGLHGETGDPMGFVNGTKSSDYTSILFNPRTTPDSLVFHGRATPPFFGAIRNTFDFNAITLSFNISYKFGHFFKRKTINYYDLFVSGKGHADFVNRWLKPGDEARTNVPAMPTTLNYYREYFYNNSETLVERADHIRLQDIRLSYSFAPRKSMRSLGVRHVQLYGYVNNIGLIWKSNDHGIDPDYPNLKLPLSCALGINASF